jgi:Flp pilus assembly protein CpaB
VIALGCGFAGSQALASLPEERDAQPDANKTPDLVTVLVAKKNLPVGTVIKEPEKCFEIKKVLAKHAPKGSFASFNRFNESNYSKLGKPISKGQFITQDHILTNDGGIAEAIPAGQVAFTFPVIAHMGNWQPMRKVNVALTAPSENGEVVSRTIMERVLVLHEAEELCRDQTGNLKLLVTLAVFPEQAAQLAGALSRGEVWLSLPKLEDVPKGPGITIAQLLARQE